MSDATPLLKTCSKCRTPKPLDDFHRDRLRGDGRASRCKECIAAYKKEYSARNQDQERERKRAHYEANREQIAKRRRQYREDNRELVAEQKAASRARNLEKERARNRAWYEANRDEIADRVQRYREENRDVIAEQRAAYRRENAEKIREWYRTYYEANRDRHHENGKAWRAANPERFRESNRRNQQQRRARKMAAAIGDIDPEALWTGACGLCGEEMSYGLAYPDPLSKSLDHIVPLALGGSHEQSNLQWTHLVCNVRKGARLPDSA